MYSVWHLVIFNENQFFLKTCGLLNMYSNYNSGWNYRAVEWGWALLNTNLEFVSACDLGQVIWPLLSTTVFSQK